jgi:hypothetical protein
VVGLHRNVRDPGRVNRCLYIVGSNNVSAFENSSGFGRYSSTKSLIDRSILAIASYGAANK